MIYLHACIREPGPELQYYATMWVIAQDDLTNFPCLCFWGHSSDDQQTKRPCTLANTTATAITITTTIATTITRAIAALALSSITAATTTLSVGLAVWDHDIDSPRHRQGLEGDKSQRITEAQPDMLELHTRSHDDHQGDISQQEATTQVQPLETSQLPYVHCAFVRELRTLAHIKVSQRRALSAEQGQDRIRDSVREFQELEAPQFYMRRRVQQSE